MGTEKFIAFKEDGTAYRLKGRILRFLDNEPVSEDDKTNIRSTLSVPASGEGLTPANNLSDLSNVATARTNLSVNSKDEDAQANALKTTAPSMYFNGTSSVVTVADDDKLTFSSSAEFGTTSSGTWSPDNNTPALTDGSGTLNQHYRVDSGAGTVTQGGSTLSVINGTATTAGQAVYYDGSVWRLKDVDDLPFSISAFIKMTDATLFSIVGKYTGTSSEREWLFWVNGSDKLNFFVQDNASGNSEGQQSTAALTSYEGQWIHVAATYGGSGPNSASAFTAASDEITIFVNGAAVAMTDVSGGTYTGMANGAGAVWIGRASSSYAKGSIRDCKIFNRELTASEVAELARGNDLGFADEFGGALGGVYASTFAGTANGWGAVNGTVNHSTSIGGESNALSLTLNTSSSQHYLYKGSLFTTGKRYRLEADFYIPSTNSNMDGIQAQVGTSSATVIQGFVAPTLDTWNKITGEFIATAGSNPDRLSFYGLASASTTFADAGGDDVLYVRNVKVTEIGTLADFRSERYDTSTSKLYDNSDNAFVGTGTSVSLTGREQPVYEHGTWTPSITFGGGSTGIAYTEQGGYYTRVGDICFVRGIVFLSNKGTDTGALKIVGLPFTSSSAGSNTSLISTYMTAAAGLTSNVVGLIDDGGTGITISDFGASGATTLDDTNVSNTTIIRFSGTYQIQ